MSMIAYRSRTLLHALRRLLPNLPSLDLAPHVRGLTQHMVALILSLTVLAALTAGLVWAPKSVLTFLALALLCCLAPSSQLARGHGEKSLINAGRLVGLALAFVGACCVAFIIVPFGR